MNQEWLFILRRRNNAPLLLSNAPRKNDSSLQCKRILGGQKFVHIRIVVAAIFDFMTEEDWRE